MKKCNVTNHGMTHIQFEFKKKVFLFNFVSMKNIQGSIHGQMI